MLNTQVKQYRMKWLCLAAMVKEKKIIQEVMSQQFSVIVDKTVDVQKKIANVICSEIFWMLPP